MPTWNGHAVETTDATHWSTRSMARRSGLSHAPSVVSGETICHRATPHQAFKLSNDPLFRKGSRCRGPLPQDRRTRPWFCVSMKSRNSSRLCDLRRHSLLPMRPGQSSGAPTTIRRHGTPTLCGLLGGCHREGYCPLSEASPVGGGPKVPRCHRRSVPADIGRPPHPGQLKRWTTRR